MIDSTVDFYNHLPLLAEVRVEPGVFDEVQQIAGDIIRANKIGSYVAISLSHRHFNLNRNTVPVWQVERGELGLKPRTYSEDLYVPVAWRVDTAGMLVPVEFASKQLVGREIRSKAQSAEFLEFGRGLLLALTEADDKSQFGLTLAPALFSEFFFPGLLTIWPYQLYYEIAGQGGDYMKIVPSTAAAPRLEDVVPTTWWMQNGTMRVAVGCHCHE